MKTIEFIDLFAGIGGIRLGFEQACDQLGIKHRCLLSSEIDKDACLTYELNFGDVPSGDIKDLKKIPKCDLLLAGFPCQTFSYAGKRQGFGDTRGTLFFEVERVIREAEKKPKALLLENVRGLITHDNSRTLKTIISHLEDLGYRIEWLLLNSCNFGVPQNRMRIYILGRLGHEPKIGLRSDRGPADSHKYKAGYSQGDLFSPGNHATYVRDILEVKPDPKYDCSPAFVQMLRKSVGDDFAKLNGVRLIDYRGGNSLHSWELGLKGKCSKEELDFMNKLISNRRKKVYGAHQDGKKLTIDQIRTFYNSPNLMLIISSLLKKGYLKKTEDRYNPVCGNMSFEVFKFLDPDSISITLVSSDAHRLGIVQNNRPRRITPRECARLQGFPDSFKMHTDDVKAYKQFGNSVSVPVVKAVVLDFLRNNRD